MADACECGNEPSGSVKCGNFLTSCKPVSFARRTLRHGISKQVSNTRTFKKGCVNLELFKLCSHILCHVIFSDNSFCVHSIY